MEKLLLLLARFAVAQHVAAEVPRATPLRDLTVNVLSPIDGEVYNRRDPIFASVDVKVGSGPGSDALRARPHDWLLCVAWNAEAAEMAAPLLNDGAGTFCKPVLQAGELPNFRPLVDLNQGESGGGEKREFRAWLQDLGVTKGVACFGGMGDPRVGTRAAVSYSFEPQNMLVNPAGDYELGVSAAAAAAAAAKAAAAATRGAEALPPPPRHCLVAVCLSGTLRTFAALSVRKRFVAAMHALASNGGGEACGVELHAHVPLPTPGSVPWAARQWADDGSGGGGSLIPAFEASFEQVFAAIEDLNTTLLRDEGRLNQRRRRRSRRQETEEGRTGGERPPQAVVGEGNAESDDDDDDDDDDVLLTPPYVRLVGVRVFDEGAHFAVPNGCPSGLPPKDSYPQLYKMAACFHTMVVPRERELKRRYDWVVRVRWDLAWLRPPPLIGLLRRDAVSLSYSFWPISDQFAVAPRPLAAAYFSAVDDFYACAEDRGDANLFVPGQVGTEVVLVRHLLAQKVPFCFVEVNAPIARAAHPKSWCAIRQTLQLPCLILAALPGWLGSSSSSSSSGGDDGGGDSELFGWSAKECTRPLGFASHQPPSVPAASPSSSPSAAAAAVSSPSAKLRRPADLLQKACERDFAGLESELMFDSGGDEHAVADEDDDDDDDDIVGGKHDTTSNGESDDCSAANNAAAVKEEGGGVKDRAGTGGSGSANNTRDRGSESRDGGWGGGPCGLGPDAASPWTSQPMEVRLGRGLASGGVSTQDSVVRVLFLPTVGSLRELAAAFKATVQEWAADGDAFNDGAADAATTEAVDITDYDNSAANVTTLAQESRKPHETANGIGSREMTRRRRTRRRIRRGGEALWGYGATRSDIELARVLRKVLTTAKYVIEVPGYALGEVSESP